jgi:hypothetical protein
VKPLYAARAGDLKWGDYIIITCACGHEALIDAVMLPSLGLEPDDRIVELARWLECGKCLD